MRKEKKMSGKGTGGVERGLCSQCAPVLHAGDTRGYLDGKLSPARSEPVYT